MTHHAVSSPASSASWYCVYAKPKAEDYAALHLRRQGFEVFLPQARVRRRIQGDIQWAVGPLFSRYLFVKTSDSSLLGRVRSTLGCVSLVAFGGQPALVPQEVIDLIRRRCADDVCELDELGLQSGDEVDIIGGPYAGMRAIFQQTTSNKERVTILLDIMASVARLKIDRRYLTRVSR